MFGGEYRGEMCVIKNFVTSEKYLDATDSIILRNSDILIIRKPFGEIVSSDKPIIVAFSDKLNASEYGPYYIYDMVIGESGNYLIILLPEKVRKVVR